MIRIPRLLLVLMLPAWVSCEAWRLERAGEQKCQQGLALLRRCARVHEAGGLTDVDRIKMRVHLQDATKLIREGLESYAKAEEKTAKPYDTRTYQEALMVCRKLVAAYRE